MKFVEQEAKAELDLFEAKLEERTKQKLKVEGGYASYMRDVLSSCMAEGDPWAICYFKFTYLPLTRIIFPYQKKELAESFPELFILVDENNTTRLLFDNLDTAVDKLQNEDLYVAGVRYKDHIKENFDQTAEVLTQLETSFEPMISSYLVLNESRVFIVVASRISAQDGEYLGALLVGYELDYGRARADTSEILGVRPVLERCLQTPGEGQETLLASEELCKYELSRQEKGITFVHVNKKGQLIRPGTTLEEGKANSVSQLVKDFIKSHPSYVSDDLLAVAVPYHLDFILESESLLALLTVDLETAVSMFTTMKLILVVVGILVFLLGLILIQVLVRSFTKPFEQIDAGIHEIIGGNFDYSFPFAFREELPRSMAQSLTIMKAVLLGQPLPEDLERDDSWAENLQVEGNHAIPEAAAAERGAQDMEIEEVAASEMTETATEYFRRLFKEYLAARTALGENVSNITYIKFVEKIAKTEKSLREKFNCRQVLFKVVTKDKQVVLVPIKVVDK